MTAAAKKFVPVTGAGKKWKPIVIRSFCAFCGEKKFTLIKGVLVCEVCRRAQQ